MAKDRPLAPPSSPPTSTASQPDGDRLRCAWTTRGRRCLLRGTAIYGFGDGETRFCSWHEDVRTSDRAKLAEDFGEFEAWCLRLRARGYCGARFEFSHADPRWLYGLVTGDDTTPLDPPSRVGCAKTSCPFGWNGQRIRDAFAGRSHGVQVASKPR
jgi:hypothetical protein